MICPNCKKEIDANSKFCPECGYNIKDKQKQVSQKNNRKFYFVGTLLFILCVLWIYSPSAPSHKDLTIPHSDTSSTSQKHKKAAPEAEGTPVNMNEPFQVDGIAEVTIKSVDFLTDVKPTTNSETYLYHYQADEGKVYAKIMTTVKNLAKESIDKDQIPRVTLFYDNGYTYRCFGVDDRRGDFETYYQLASLTPERIQYLAQVPAEVKDNGKPVKVQVEIDGKKFLCNVDGFTI